MEKIQIFVESLIAAFGIHGETVSVLTVTALVIVAILLAAASGWICRRIVVPAILKLTAKTDFKWDDIIFNSRVLLTACSIVPAIVIWMLLPSVFFDQPTIKEILARITAIYITVMTVRTVFVFIESFRLLENGKRTARQQYLYSICGVLKIIMLFIAVIVIISIIIDKDPTTLLAGLGAASAIIMLVFQDTIKGLVAGIRLTNNDMLHIGDWITVTSAGVNGRVEDINLTTVKVRNFDNTIVTISPQALVDGSFQNWMGMEQNQGRKQTRTVYFDFRSIRIDDDGIANITKFRKHIEQWLVKNPKVIAEKTPLVRQAEGSQGGCCLECTFWLYAQAWVDYEHDTADIMEYIYASSAEYGLTIYQPFPQQ